MKWTNAKIAQLKKLWKKGSIAQEIGQALGTTKSAVIGKANRLQCASRKMGRIHSAPNVIRLNGYTKRPSRSRREIINSVLTEMEPENPTHLENLTPTQCKFPLGEEKDPVEFFCGRERWIGPRKHGPSYCKYHTYVAAKLEDPRRAIRP